MKVIIVGGGISGLVAAHRLLELNREVEIEIFDSRPQLGGVIETEQHDDFILEGGPDSFLSEKPWAHELAERIGLKDEIISTQTKHRKSLILRNGRLVEVPAGFYLMAPTRLRPFIKSPLLSWRGKLRVMMDILIRQPSGELDESVANFARRRFGREAYQRIIQPMVGGIYTADPEKLSMKAALPRFAQIEKEFHSVIRGLKNKKQTAEAAGPRYGLFLSFQKGIGQLIQRLEEKLSDVKIHKGKVVVSVIPVKAGIQGLDSRFRGNDKETYMWQIDLESGESTGAHVVILALPAHESARLVKFDADLAKKLSAIHYESAATVNLAFNREDVAHPLDGFGFIVPATEKKSFLACSFSNMKYAGRAPEGKVLLRAFVGGALQPQMFTQTDEAITRIVFEELKPILGLKAKPLFTQVRRYPHSMPQYHVGHQEKVAEIQSAVAKHSGLHLIGNAYSGVGIPDCIRNAEQTAEKIVHGL